MADVVASFRARSLPVRLGGAHVRASNGTDIALDGTLSTVSSNVPAFDRDRGVRLEAGATNLALRSSELDNASWSKNNCTITADAAMSPDGATGFDKIVENSATAFHGVSQLLAVSSGQRYTQSFFVKAAERSWCMLTEGNNVTASAWFNLSTGTVGTVSGTGSPAATITSIGLGIYRVALSFTPISTVANVQVRPTTGDAISSYAGDGSSGIYAWGAQLEAGSFATSYIPTTSAAVLRQPSYISSTLSALGVASQVNEYTIAVAVRPAFPSTVVVDSVQAMMIAGIGQASSGLRQLRIEFSTVPGRVQAWMYDGATSYSAGVNGLTWSPGDVLNLRMSKSAAHGIVFVAGSTVAVNGSAGAKADFSSALNVCSVGARTENTQPISYLCGVVAGALFADRAYSQAELEALSVDDFLPTNTGTYIEDDWIDTTGTVATSHTIRRKRGSEAWAYTDSFGGTGSSSSITVQSNRIQFASANSSIVTDLGETDYTLEFPWHIGSTSGERVAIPIRWTDINNQYYLNLREPNDDWTIYKIAGGVQTTVATGSYTFNTSTTYMVKIVVSGTSVHAYINDVSLTGAQTMDTSLTATKAGLGTAGSTTAVTLGTVRFHNNVQIAATGDIDPDGQTALTLAGFVAAPDEAYYREIAADLEGTPTTSSAQVNVPLTDFAPDGAHETTRWRTDYDLVLSDGVDTLVQSAQVDPVLTPNAEDFTLTSGASVVDGYNPVPGAVGGDDFFAYWHTGDGVRNQSIAGLSDAGSGYMVPATLPAQGRRMAYDVSAGAWLGAVDTAYFNIPSVGAKRVVGGIMASLRRGML